MLFLKRKIFWMKKHVSRKSCVVLEEIMVHYAAIIVHCSLCHYKLPIALVAQAWKVITLSAFSSFQKILIEEKFGQVNKKELIYQKMGIYMSVINILKKKFQRDLRVSYIFFIECLLSKYVLEWISATMHFTLIVTWSGYSQNQRNHFT